MGVTSSVVVCVSLLFRRFNGRLEVSLIIIIIMMMTIRFFFIMSLLIDSNPEMKPINH